MELPKVYVDFGTSRTCLIVQADNLPPGGVTSLSEFVATSDDPDQAISSVVHLVPRTSRPEPYCAIGDTLLRDVLPDVESFAKFKPEIGEAGTSHRLMGSAGGSRGRQLTADDLTFYFLRELVLAARRRLGGRAIGAFHVTCPTAFGQAKRAAYDAVLRRLCDYGIVGESSIIMDEANAAALAEIQRYFGAREDPPPELRAMVIDFGGGTLDIAVLHARRRSGTPQGRHHYDLRPLGVTGIRDLGGRNVNEWLLRFIQDKWAKTYASGGKHYVPIHVDGPFAPTSAEDLIYARRNAAEIGRWVEQYKCRALGKKDVNAFLDWSRAELRLFGRSDSGWVRLLGETGRPYIDKLVSEMHEGNEALDKALNPAIGEAMGRARRLWERVLGNNAVDLVIICGGASRLPQLHQCVVAPTKSGGLGIDPKRVAMDELRLKVAVVEGAARYGHYRRLPKGSLHVELDADAYNVLLRPIVFEESGGTYQALFEHQHPVGRDVPRAYDCSVGEVLLNLFEDIDLRPRPWRPAGEMAELNLRAAGKEPLTPLALPMDMSGSGHYIHRLEVRDDRLWLQVWPEGHAESRALRKETAL